MALTAALSVTSHSCTTISPPTAFTLSTVSAVLAGSRSTANTLAPSSAKRTHVARPLPQPGPTLPAPVMMAMRSCRRPGMSCSFLFEAVEAARIVDQHGLQGRAAARSRPRDRPAGRRPAPAARGWDAASRCPRRSGRRTPPPACARTARRRHKAGLWSRVRRSAPLTFTHTFVSASSASRSRNGCCASPREASTRPMWSIITGTGERRIAGASSPMRSAAMCSCKCQPSVGEPPAEGDDLVDRRAVAEMGDVMEARAAVALRVERAQLGVRDRGRHQRDAEIGAAFGGERVGWSRAGHNRARPSARSRSARCRAIRAARTALPWARRPGCGPRHRESARPARTHAHARRRRPAAGSAPACAASPSRSAAAAVMCQIVSGAVRAKAGSRRAKSSSQAVSAGWCARHSTGLRQSR